MKKPSIKVLLLSGVISVATCFLVTNFPTKAHIVDKHIEQYQEVNKVVHTKANEGEILEQSTTMEEGETKNKYFITYQYGDDQQVVFQTNDWLYALDKIGDKALISVNLLDLLNK